MSQFHNHTKPKLSDFQIGVSLGKGKFSEVFIARDNRYGFYVALKIMDKSFLKEHGLEQQVEREIKIHSLYNHPCILQMYGYFTDASHIYMILEVSDQGDLFSYFKSRPGRRLSETEARKYVRDIVTALKELHSNNIIHRDLKPENILLCDGVAKLADFGLASHNNRHKRTTFCGTLDYIAPEMFDRDGHNQKVDVWSVGVLAYELCHGEPPFLGKDEEQVQERIRENAWNVPDHFSHDLRNFVQSILTSDERLRPSMEQVLESAWLSQ